MLIFGACFILYILKLCNISGIWGNLHQTDKKTYKSNQKVLRKWMKAKHDMHFVHKCKFVMDFIKSSKQTEI